MKLFRLLVAFGVLFAMGSCLTRRVAIVGNAVRDSIVFARHERDSIYRQDSVSMYNRGETVYVDRFKYIYRYKTKRDTFLVHHSDTVNVPVYVRQDTSSSPWKWKWTFLLGGFILFVFCASLIKRFLF